MMAFCRYRTPPWMSLVLRLLVPDEKSSLFTRAVLRSDNGSQGNTSTFGYLLSQIFRMDQDAIHICTTFHCNIHDENNIVRPYIFHWLKTTIISSSMTAWISKRDCMFWECSYRNQTKQNTLRKHQFSSEHFYKRIWGKSFDFHIIFNTEIALCFAY